jgi:hypothetical protein
MENKGMKTFLEQYRECHKAGLKIKKVPITPDLLPICPAKAKKMLKIIRKEKLTHFDFFQCRFDENSTCSSNVKICKEMRNK